MIYLQLFLSFLQIGAFSFGGGYAAMPLIQDQVVARHGWLSAAEFTDLITISQMTPGPIAINSATFVGTRIAGAGGAAAATFGCVLPSCILVTLLARLYLRYRNLTLLQEILRFLRPAVIAMIAVSGISILTTAFWGSLDNPDPLLKHPILLLNLDLHALFLFSASILALTRFRKNPITVMLMAGAAQVMIELLRL